MILAINGILIGIVCTLLCVLAIMTIDYRKKKMAELESLQDIFKSISEAHNALVSSLKEVDKKANDIALRVDLLSAKKGEVKNIFTGKV